MTEQESAPISKLRIDRQTAPGSASGKPAGRRRTLRIALVVAGVIVLVLIVSSIVGRAPHVQTAAVTRMYPSQMKQMLIASGYVVAQRKAAVASKGTGRLVALNVVEGDRVKTGDVLARIESADMDAAHAQARAALEQLKAALVQARAEEQDATNAWKRASALVDKGSISRSEADAAEARAKRAVAGITLAEANVRQAEAAVRAAAVQIENTYIRAPFSGTVLTKNADVGEVVAPFGASANARGAVLTMADMTSLEVEVDVSESQIQNVHPGQPCEIVLDAYPEQRYSGRVTKIVPTADRTKATVLTKIRFDDLDGRVLPEMSAKASFLSEPLPNDRAARAARTVVPKDAVLHRGGATVVFVVNDGALSARTITTGAEMGDMIEVTSGVNPGEKIVRKPASDMKDGQSVQADKD